MVTPIQWQLIIFQFFIHGNLLTRGMGAEGCIGNGNLEDQWTPLVIQQSISLM